MKKGDTLVILVNWNNYQDTIECLECFQLHASKYDVIIVDNHSSNDSVDQIIRNHPWVKIIESPKNLGFAGGNNLALEYGLKRGYDYFLLLNNDTLFDYDFIVPLKESLQKDPNTAAVQPLIFHNVNRSKIWNSGGRYYPFLAKTDSGSAEVKQLPTEVDWLTGCAILTKAEFVKKVGLLNDHFFMYYEDVDWSFRIRKLNKKLLLIPKAQIFHKAGASQKGKRSKEGTLSPKTHYYSFRNRIYIARLYSRWFHWPSSFAIIFTTYFLYSIYFLTRGRMEKLVMVNKALIHGIFSKII
jgi:hypothetical protein